MPTGSVASPQNTTGAALPHRIRAPLPPFVRFPFEHCFRVELVGAAAVTITDGHLDVTTGREGQPETVVRKH